jgi:lipoprotein-releasing system ATP-binding protein
MNKLLTPSLTGVESASPSVVIQAQSLHKHYSEGTGRSKLEVAVIQGLDLQIRRSESLALVGASGSGKSTLLHILGGLETPSSGRVSLMGRDLAQMSAQAVSAWRNQHLGFVYQFHHLLPEFTALDNVAMPLRIRRIHKEPARERAAEALRKVGLGERLQHRPSQLSGGERQRVAIARALVSEPAALLADEPTGNLDRQTAIRVFEQLLALSREKSTALVLVTHDESLAKRCDHQWQLLEGRLRPA